ncbi:hypothetical protein, partial [Citrobacter sp. S46_ASV_140]|uniref:hypothetical protein n=1 Tax=Citrobacter sp. S46_ASV_140 TaxID=2846983 RepID=UPI001C0EF23A
NNTPKRIARRKWATIYAIVGTIKVVVKLMKSYFVKELIEKYINARLPTIVGHSFNSVLLDKVIFENPCGDAVP